MDPHQRRRGLHIPHHQGYSFLEAAVSVGAELSPKTMDAKISPATGKIRGRHLLNSLVGQILVGHISIIAVTRRGAGRAELI